MTIDAGADDFSTVSAIDDINDVLAQIFFDVPSDVAGNYTLRRDSRLLDST